MNVRAGWTIGLFAGMLLPTGLGLAAAEMVIVQDGQPQATIVVAKEAAESARQKIRTAAGGIQSRVLLYAAE